MSPRRRFGAFAVLAVLLVGAVAGTVIFSLYRVGLEREREHLVHLVESQAALSEAVYSAHLAEASGDAAEALYWTLEHLEGAAAGLGTLDGVGGLAISRIVRDTLVIEIAVGVDASRAGERVPLPSSVLALHQDAVLGASGTTRTVDHRGVEVLAAYAPVRGAGLGIVAKVDIQAARAPFATAALGSAVFALVLLGMTLAAGRVVSAPLIAEVEERERAHRAFLEHFPGIVFRAVPDDRHGWRFETFEGAAEELSGYPARRFRGPAGAWLDLAAEEDRTALMQWWGAYGSGEFTESNAEHRLLRKDGSMAWVRVLARAEPGPPGMRPVTGVIYDITAERRAREVRRRAEEELLAVVEHLPGAAVFVLDRDLRFRFSGGEALAAMGLGGPDLKGRLVEDIMAPDRARRIRAVGSRVIEGELARFEEEFGGRAFQLTATPIRNSEDTVDRVLVLSLDVTREREAEEALRVSEERLRLALLAGRHGLYDLDLGTGEATVNDHYAQMLGHDPATFRETNAAWRDRLHPDDRDAAFAEFQAYVAGERDAYRVEFRQRTADGQWRWVLSLGDIVEWDENGHPVRMMGTHTDIHAMKEAEAQIRHHLDELRRWQAVMLDREDRVQELKREVNDLCRRAGVEARYPSQEGGAE